MLMRATTASNAARTRASSKLASAAICAFRIEPPTADGAICRAARRIFRAVARSRVIGIASPCFSALRLERALPAAVLGPRLRAPLRRLAAICLSVAILMITIRRLSVSLRGESTRPAALLLSRSSISSLRFPDFELPLSFFGSASALYAAGLRLGAGARWRFFERCCPNLVVEPRRSQPQFQLVQSRELNALPTARGEMRTDSVARHDARLRCDHLGTSHDVHLAVFARHACRPS